MEDQKETINFSKIHPNSDSLFIFGTNKGTLKMCDLRLSSLASSNTISFRNESAPAQKNFIMEMISAYSSG
jgi:serine/threonine-protein phosphatase 2A regulatory subunit B